MRRARLLVGAVAAAAAVAGCGHATQTTETVTVTAPAETAAPAGKAASAKPARPSSSARPRKARGASSAARGRVACDANITLKAATTSCPFGQNVFYGFWKAQDDGDDAFRAYSPVSKRSYEMTCTSGVTVVCRAGDGGEVRFSRASVDAYDTAQAARYAATHDTGPADDAGPAAGGRGAGSGQADAAAGSDCDSSYEGACLEPDALDYDCAGGSGDGPEYTDTVRVVGDDHYDLDRDGDGVACDS
jgi:hypothetical protein